MTQENKINITEKLSNPGFDTSNHFKVMFGTFFLCFGLLVYEIFCTRILDIVEVNNNFVIFIIVLAMLGMSAATSFMSLSSWPSKNMLRLRELSWLCLLLGVSYIFAFCLITLFNNYSNELIETSLNMGGLKLLVASFHKNFLIKILICGFLMFLPYFIYGISTSILYRSAPVEYFHKIYFADLIGAATGCFACILAFEYGGFQIVLALVLLSTFFAAIFYSPLCLKTNFVLALIFCLLTLVIVFWPPLLKYFEPKPNQSLLAHDWNKKHRVREVWHTWNSYSRVSLLSIDDTTYIYGLGNGDSWAFVPNLSSNVDRAAIYKGSTAHFAALFDPKNVLVMFAGVGNDMAQIDFITNGKADITGVELNSQMVENALLKDSFGLKDFYSKQNINLVVSEGREYLGRDHKKYDSILLSWSGASVSYYVGTCGQTTQYLYTKEAFESLLDHLTPRGILIISNSSKAQALLIFRSIFNERGWGNLSDSVVIVRPLSSKDDECCEWDAGWDLNHLIISRSAFKTDRLNGIYKTAAENGYDIVLAPGYTHPKYTGYQKIINDENPKPLMENLIKEKGIQFSVITDDRPFPLDFTPRSLIITPSLWFSSKGPNQLALIWRYTKVVFYIYMLIIFALAILLILCPLFLKSGPNATIQNVNHLIYFFCLGTGFMLIEVGLIQKLSLLLGNPGYSISVILASLILASGIGSYYSKKLYASKKFTFNRNVILLFLYVFILMQSYEKFVKHILPFQIIYKMIFVVIFIFPLGFLMGQLFPQGLVKVEKEERNLIPWAWAVNGAASTIAVGVGVLMSHPLGFNFITYTGAFFYALILLLPHYRR